MGASSAPQLALDLGNSAVKAATFQDGHLGPVFQWTAADDWRLADEAVTNSRVNDIILSTVANVPPPQWMDKWRGEGRRVVLLPEVSELPFRSRYRTMATLGQDRIAVVAGVCSLRKDTAPAAAPALIADAGTCLTLDLLDGEGTYHGGNISPGLRLRLASMAEHTVRLPRVEPGEVKGWVGDATATALRHGGQLGLVYEIEGLFRRLSVDFPGLELFLTGGDAPNLLPYFSVPCRHFPHLVLRGLHHILTTYVQHHA